MVLRQIANEVDATLNQVVIAWLAQADPPIVPIIGGSTLDQLHENLGSATLELSDDQVHRLTAAGASSQQPDPRQDNS
jgi:aryl-alcohol dehydrogenase-like predicted oxidoreductase